MNHSGTFADSSDMAGLTVRLKFHRNRFYFCVGCHNGLCGSHRISVFHFHASGMFFDALHAESLADYAGGRHNHILHRDMERTGRSHCLSSGILNPKGGAGVGIAGIDDHRPGLSV